MKNNTGVTRSERRVILNLRSTLLIFFKTNPNPLFFKFKLILTHLLKKFTLTLMLSIMEGGRGKYLDACETNILIIFHSITNNTSELS